MKAFLTRADGKIVASVEVRFHLDGGSLALDVQSYNGTVAGMTLAPSAGAQTAGPADPALAPLGVVPRLVRSDISLPPFPGPQPPDFPAPPLPIDGPPPGFPINLIVYSTMPYPAGSTIVEVYAATAPQVGQLWYCTAISAPPEHVLCDQLTITAVVDEGPAPAFVQSGWHKYRLTLSGPTTAPVASGQGIAIKTP